MPSPRPSPRRPSSDPLANLPRPLSERGRGGGLRRLVVPVAVAALILGGFAIVRPGFGTSGDGGVQGAVATPDHGASESPDEVAVVGTPAAPVATATLMPVPTPTPVPTPIPEEELTGYQWPLPRGRLTQPFGPSAWGSRVVGGELYHDGIDLSTFCGDKVVAAHGGTVLAAGRHFDELMGWVGDLQPYLDRLDKKKAYGTLPIVVIIDDGNGYRSIYAHFSKVKVKKGQVVKAGQMLGWEGATGRASGCHVHYGLFSPLETETFGIDPEVVKRMKVPDQQIARIDPLLVLPDRPKKPKPSPTAAP